MNQNNSAHRLCNILEKAVAMQGGEEDTTLIIGRAMGIQDFSNKCFMTDFFVLIADVEHSILRLKNVTKKEAYIKTIREIQTIFFVHNLANTHWQSIKSIIISGNLTTILDACANFIDREFPIIDLNDEELSDYLLRCNELLSEVAESDLANDLKTFLTVRLEEICSAIRHYSIGGPERLRNVVEANIGGMILKSAGISPKDCEQPILKKLFSLFLTFGSLLGMYTDSKSLLDSGSITKLFSPVNK
jgi:hypothetical protein